MWLWSVLLFLRVIDCPTVGLIMRSRGEIFKFPSNYWMVSIFVFNFLSKLHAVFNLLAGGCRFKPVISKLCDNTCFSYRWLRSCSTRAPTPTILVDLAGISVLNCYSTSIFESKGSLLGGWFVSIWVRSFWFVFFCCYNFWISLVMKTNFYL